jgi:UDP-N-acetylmuramoylalanine--D-glutamate ligase
MLAATLDQAMTNLPDKLSPDDVVLLSPGFASWDQFESFEQRGNAFVAQALRITSEEVPPPRK